MKSSDIRAKYLKFFESRGHAIIPAAPIVPLEDPTTLFTSSGMQPLVPYLKGQPHPMGTRLVDSQPSFRAEDIEEIGDNRHTCMFEMLGNWSLGDYFKSEQLPWFFEFMTKEVGLDQSRLYVTVFEGDEYAARDDEAISIWQKVFQTKSPAKKGVEGFDPNTKIYMYPAKKNWWSRSGVPAKMPAGEIGGPDSEMFYDFGAELKLHENSPWKDEVCHVNCDCGRFMEIGNSVFMQFEKTEDGKFKPLPKQNVDYGGGLERITAASNGDPDVFKIDMFAPIIKAVETSSGKSYEGNEAPMRVIADHLRAATFMMSEGLVPSNKMQGYVLRRLIRRAIIAAMKLGGDPIYLVNSVVPIIIQNYSEHYTWMIKSEKPVLESLQKEVENFIELLNKGKTRIQKDSKLISELRGGINDIGTPFSEKTKLGNRVRGNQYEIEKVAELLFNYFQSYGIPLEVSYEEMVKIKPELQDFSLNAVEVEFAKQKNLHSDKSRTASAGMFKGGLADHSEITTKLHTATHLLHKALRTVLGAEVHQAGSNITPERLRFDYTFAGKPTKEQLVEIEQIINDAISADYPVTRRIEDKEEAINSGAMAFFAEKYPDKVSVYIIGTDPDKDWFSKELCGGPHVENTGVIGKVSIVKDESLGSGTRRIYARLQ